MKTTRQAKGGMANNAAKQAASRAKRELGRRPRKSDRTKAPHVFLGVFGYNLNSDVTDDRRSDDVRFTALVEATDINGAVSSFRRLMRHPQIKDAINGNYVEMMTCVEIQSMPPDGLVAFYESLQRDPSEPSYWGSINGSAITVPAGHDGINVYGYKGAFVRGKHYVERILGGNDDENAPPTKPQRPGSSRNGRRERRNQST